jgi:transposase
MAYTTDLTLPQFAKLAPLLPQSKTYRNVISRHEIVNAILYQLKNGCQWRDLPADFPNWQTVYSQFRRWQLDGTWERVLAALARSERESVKKTNIPAC